MSIKKRFFGKILTLVLLLACFMGMPVFAAENDILLSSEKDGNSLILYIQNPGEIEEITGQIGTTPCTDIAYLPISESGFPIKTLLLLDNSMSTTENYRPMIQEIMRGLIENHAEGELFSIATFSEDITYLAKDSGNYDELTQVLNEIEYSNQNTHLTDVLYELFTEWAESEETGYRRIVIFSDGLDNRIIGYTREELMQLIDKHSYPIYSIGCAEANDQTAEGLENMFALSRATGGISWMFGDITSSDEVVQKLTETENLICVKIDVPEALRDGMQRGVKLSVKTAEGTKDISAVMEMPFGVSDETEMPRGKSIPPYIIIIVPVAVAAIVAAVVLKLRRQRADESCFQTAPKGAAPQIENIQNDGQMSNKIEVVAEPYYSSGETVMIWGNNRIVLTDEKNKNYRFEASLSTPITIGRGRDTGCTIMLDYDTSVSRRPHCRIRMENGAVTVQDLGSSNGTYLNGHRVEQETRISSGDILKIGRVEMRVELY